ncbi:hypothetical protein HMPREF0202_01120 [Cetobacterium somerae ATCC BAA-474]|uniref:Lipocalin-like domain-containing protein n=1 Tax=Cetobacterium somerae ATCC BAA-474 TaxID=1319815 RepID=U7VDR1_9FUSO|nr:hypothetical protein [Cetobacterium somerae]ERT68953.1 hypothetical protein HMPREF0202_01120 [Cetobacterium somerae ATCC BAA-474]
MKKITLLFLALSSLTLAGVSTTSNPNLTNSVTDSNATASININVTATVTGPLDLIITDANGTPISEVTFDHILIAGQGEQSLTANLRVSGNAITSNADVVSLSSEFGTNSLTLKNLDTSQAILTSKLTAYNGGYDNNGVVLNVTSTLNDGQALAGNYETQTTTLTVTYAKTK